ncbi:MAG TPA: TetR/AcrR family transcriptional regulator, partial [Kiloniellales bacterium]|nr:TetR/AcrR family transcriptional regulator [Kiloniellales bacterium]
AVGIDRLLAESGVAKMTLYKHFGSKEALILEVLRRRDARWRAWFQGAVERRAAEPRARLLAVFDALEEWLRSPRFSGCMFVKAASEFADPGHPAHAAAAEHQQKVLAYLRGLAEAAGAKRPARLARALMLLLQGAVVVTQVNGPVGAARAARDAARSVIAEALGDTGAAAPAPTG